MIVKRRLHKDRGFSLIEVTVATGIISFVFLSLCGLIQTGLGIHRDSIDRTVAAQIAQALLNEKQQTSFADLCDPSKTPAIEERYFDNDGEELQGDKARTVYIARTELRKTPTLPATGAIPFTNPNIVQLQIRILFQPGGKTLSNAWTGGKQTREYIQFIAKS